MKYSYCETLVACTWHIRPLTENGKKLSGGADTRTLCGAEAKWDVRYANPDVKTELFAGDGVCRACRAKFTELSTLR